MNDSCETIFYTRGSGGFLIYIFFVKSGYRSAEAASKSLTHGRGESSNRKSNYNPRLNSYAFSCVNNLNCCLGTVFLESSESY